MAMMIPAAGVDSLVVVLPTSVLAFGAFRLFGKNRERGGGHDHPANGPDEAGASQPVNDPAAVKERLLQRRMDTPRGSASAAWVLLHLEVRLRRTDGVAVTLAWVEIRNLLGLTDEHSQELYDRLISPLDTEQVTYVVHPKLKMGIGAAWSLSPLGAEVCERLRGEGRGTDIF